MSTKRRGLYKHRNNEDVAAEVLSQFYIKEKDCYWIKLRWWNISRDRVHEPFNMNIIGTFKIPAKVWREEWKPYALYQERT